ncbi:MAG: ABC transporter permease [Nitrospirae bacterium]|nr:MAG: ABC transporter permease [Nitrospirota bacterium]
MVYSFKVALRSLWFYRWINLLSILSIATGLFIFGTVLFSLYNLEQVTRRAPEKFTITVFLKDRAKDAEIQELVNWLNRESLISRVKYTSKDEALKELKSSLADAAYVLEGLDENPLFPSIEIKLREDAFNRKDAELFIKKLKGKAIVEDVFYGEDIFSSIKELYRNFRLISVALIVLFSIAIVFVCYSTVKILFFKRSEEIEIYKLLGATKAFIRGPFIFEGTMIGLLGGVLSSAGLYGVFNLLKGLGNPVIPLMSTLELEPAILVIIPVSGLLLGLIGSVIALGRLKY